MTILTLFVTWNRRVSHLMVKGVTHEISKVSVWGLRIGVCVLFTATLTMTALNTGAEILRSLAFDSSNDFYSEFNEEWMTVLSVLMPYNSDFPLSLGNRFLVEKRDQEAKAQILSAFRARPLSPQVSVAVASLSACTGDEDTAVSLFNTNVAKNYVPDNTTELMTARLLGLPESKAAIKLISLTLEHSPQLASLYINLMTLYGYKPLTLKPLLPEQPLVMLALGDLLLSEGHTDEAEKAYMEAVLNNNENLARDETLYARIATYFSKTKRLTRALFIAKAGRERYPDSEKIKYLLLDISAQLGLEK